MYEEGETWCNRACENFDIVTLNQKLLIKWLHALYFETPYEEANLPGKTEKYYREALVSEPENPYRHNALANQKKN